MSWLNYTEYTTYTPLSDAQERNLTRQALSGGREPALIATIGHALVNGARLLQQCIAYSRGVHRALAIAYPARLPADLS